MIDWKSEREARRAEEDRRLDEHYRDLQATPFEPSAGETIGATIGGMIGIAFQCVWLLVVCVIVYLVGKAVIG
jgi:tetrahydromethanopterin S-methyltransferase subunit G